MNRYYIATERADLFDVNMVVGISVDVIGLLEKSQIVDASFSRRWKIISLFYRKFYESINKAGDRIYLDETS